MQSRLSALALSGSMLVIVACSSTGQNPADPTADLSEDIGSDSFGSDSHTGRDEEDAREADSGAGDRPDITTASETQELDSDSSPVVRSVDPQLEYWEAWTQPNSPWSILEWTATPDNRIEAIQASDILVEGEPGAPPIGQDWLDIYELTNFATPEFDLPPGRNTAVTARGFNLAGELRLRCGEEVFSDSIDGFYERILFVPESVGGRCRVEGELESIWPGTGAGLLGFDVVRLVGHLEWHDLGFVSASLPASTNALRRSWLATVDDGEVVVVTTAAGEGTSEWSLPPTSISFTEVWIGTLGDVPVLVASDGAGASYSSVWEPQSGSFTNWQQFTISPRFGVVVQGEGVVGVGDGCEIVWLDSALAELDSQEVPGCQEPIALRAWGDDFAFIFRGVDGDYVSRNLGDPVLLPRDWSLGADTTAVGTGLVFALPAEEERVLISVLAATPESLVWQSLGEPDVSAEQVLLGYLGTSLLLVARAETGLHYTRLSFAEPVPDWTLPHSIPAEGATGWIQKAQVGGDYLLLRSVDAEVEVLNLSRWLSREELSAREIEPEFSDEGQPSIEVSPED
ncbi:MAG: hypothetical protein KC561_12085, partial [Myxococcales bacterium]|nr:hypothetical protein [Myxococcales bacterium]